MRLCGATRVGIAIASVLAFGIVMEVSRGAGADEALAPGTDASLSNSQPADPLSPSMQLSSAPGLEQNPPWFVESDSVLLLREVMNEPVRIPTREPALNWAEDRERLLEMARVTERSMPCR